MPRTPMTPKSWTAMEATTTQMMAANQGLMKTTVTAKKTAARMDPMATNSQNLRPMYCSQKVKGVPDGKLGKPRSSNF